ncbi:MAG: hypothetical protein PHQ52_02595 [Candidatus Omnitrophica bacterium]|nr:hypothetical protein [Candidatus Omnitrophota bacterium]
MKKIIGVILIGSLMFLPLSFAMDTSKITQENLEACLKAFPKYVELMKQYDYDEGVSNFQGLPQEAVTKATDLLKSYGFSIQTFSQVFARIMSAYSSAEMRMQGYGGMMPQMIQTSPEEDKIIDNNLDKIREVMSSQD